MKYMLLIYGEESRWANLSPEDAGKVFNEYMTYTQELAQAGILRGGNSLKPVTTATTVRERNGKVMSTDGPFAETKEQLGGFYTIDVATLDEAIKWAAKCPGARYGSMEIRPLGDESADNMG